MSSVAQAAADTVAPLGHGLPVHRHVACLLEATLPLSAPMCATQFDEALYRALNPDLDVDLNAAEHWRSTGEQEQRRGLRPTVDQMRFYDGQEIVIPSYRPRVISPERLRAKPFGVNFFAPFSTRTGLGQAARGYAEALRVSGVPYELVNINYDLRPAQVALRDRTRRPRYRVNLLQVNADSIERVMAMFPPDHFDDGFTIAIWAWELNALRTDWYASFRFCDEVWGLSDFNTASIAAFAPLPVRTVPPPVLPPRFVPATRDALGLPPGFLFLTAFDIGSSIERKNPFAVIQAFQAAFPDRQDAHLVLKFHSGRHDPSALHRLMAAVEGNNRIIVRAGHLSGEEMAALQATCDCFVSAHRAEGLGLGLAEMMLQGKPVIATGYSGNLQFMSETNSFLVDYRLRPIGVETGPYPPDYLWAEPDLDSLVRQMQRVVDDPALRERVAVRAMGDLSASMSPKRIGQTIRARLDELELSGTGGRALRSAGRTAALKLPPDRALPAGSTPMPCFSIVPDLGGARPEALDALVSSVRGQIYPHWEMCFCCQAGAVPSLLAQIAGTDPRFRVVTVPGSPGSAEAINAAATLATGAFLMFPHAADSLTSDALSLYARSAAQGLPDVIYADDAAPTAGPDLWRLRRLPSWSPEHLEAEDYVGRTPAIRTALFLRLGGMRPSVDGAMLYDLMLRAGEQTVAVNHLPNIALITGPATAEPAQCEQAVREHLVRCAGTGAVVSPGLRPATRRIEVLPPSADTALLLLPDTEGSSGVDPAPNGVLLVRGGHVGSWAQRANAAWRSSKAAVLVLLTGKNVAVVSDWLEALVNPCLRSGVGLVAGRPRDYPIDTVRNGIVPTGAPIAVSRHVLLMLGGFDSRFGEVQALADFRLRLAQLALRTVYTPFAAVHRAVPPDPATVEEMHLFRSLWGHITA